MTKSERYKYHGHSGNNKNGVYTESFYQLYRHIRERCSYPKNKDYPRYGAKGITFEWDSYQSFKTDMYRSYQKHVSIHGKENTTIDRIDNSKGYSKENCRWATRKMQSKNRKTNRYITYKGRTMVIADWARELGVSRQAVRYRLECGWTPKQIVETPFSHANRITKQ